MDIDETLEMFNEVNKEVKIQKWTSVIEHALEELGNLTEIQICNLDDGDTVYKLSGIEYDKEFDAVYINTVNL